MSDTPLHGGQGLAPHRRRRAFGLLGLLLGLGGVARAQEADEAFWVNIGLQTPALDIVELSDHTLLALGADGAVWRKAPGHPWRRTTQSPWSGPEELSEEDRLLEAEATLGEEVEDSVSDPDSAEEDPTADEALPEEVEVEEVDAAELVDQSELANEAVSVDGLDHIGGMWVIPTVPEQVITSGPAGSYLSEDGGISWRALTSLPSAHELISVPGERVVTVAATAEGLRHNVAGSRSWFGVSGPLDAVEVRGLATGDGIFYAGTADGVYWSGDGLRWAACAGGGALDVRAIAADPALPGGLWVATPGAILRSDDRGATFRKIGRNPLKGTRSLLALPQAGGLIAVGEDGLWESTDGGVRWSPRVRGLPGPDQHAVILGAEGLLLAGSSGVYGLAAEAPAEAVASGVAPKERLPPVSEVVGVALRRSGLNIEPLLIQRAFLRSLYTPQLALAGSHERRDTLSADYDALQNTRDELTVWTARLELCFGACATTSSSSSSEDGYTPEEMAADPDAITEGADLVVVGDKVYAAGEGDYSALAANVANEVSRYRNAVAEQVTELYFNRIRLTQERARADAAPLGQQIDRELELQLVTARLDALTLGYFSQALAGQNVESP